MRLCGRDKHESEFSEACEELEGGGRFDLVSEIKECAVLLRGSGESNSRARSVWTVCLVRRLPINLS